MVVGPLKVLRKAAEPPASGLRRIPKTLKPTNRLRPAEWPRFYLAVRGRRVSVRSLHTD